MIRVLIADDHTLVRQGLRALLEKDPEIKVVGEAVDGLEAVEKIKGLEPDVVVLDLSMPYDGLKALEEIGKITKVIVLSMYKTKEHIVGAIRKGALGYVSKDAVALELIEGIKHVFRYKTFYLGPSLENEQLLKYLREGKSPKLTPREQEILGLISQGYTNKEIAAALKISIKTVETHRAHITKKLDIHTTAELILFAILNSEK
jgi:DNA-binding NarL/FixJ family response regulator